MEELSREDWKVFLFAVKKVKGGKACFPKDESKVISFINDIFCKEDYFTAAWKTTGFPFEKINGIYLKLTGKEHPKFEELFVSQV
jgi:hypothetical protein